MAAGLPNNVPQAWPLRRMDILVRHVASARVMILVWREFFATGDVSAKTRTRMSKLQGSQSHAQVHDVGVGRAGLEQTIDSIEKWI